MVGLSASQGLFVKDVFSRFSEEECRFQILYELFIEENFFNT
ncbi:hypothetical protein SACS_1218 [Parasaccharibacter apium]|uniref:Uncharacterized protein n=1 Tax=Parasaccharibacter apium TaxID=1510841 RepID=A0A7U7G6C4_9PROT|nr:hypothetical protein SACS_1218 [Parasaccharibacter apium]